MFVSPLGETCKGIGRRPVQGLGGDLYGDWEETCTGIGRRRVWGLGGDLYGD